jgi:hypothetical protein
MIGVLQLQLLEQVPHHWTIKHVQRQTRKQIQLDYYRTNGFLRKDAAQTLNTL